MQNLKMNKKHINILINFWYLKKLYLMNNKLIMNNLNI
jgi:hypothetical protein